MDLVNSLRNKTSEYAEGLEPDDMSSGLEDFASAIGGAVIAAIVLFGCLCLCGVGSDGPRSGSHFARV